jgi:hypothetical protein
VGWPVTYKLTSRLHCLKKSHCKTNKNLGYAEFSSTPDYDLKHKNHPTKEGQT